MNVYQGVANTYIRLPLQIFILKNNSGVEARV